MITSDVIASLWNEIVSWYVRRCRNWNLLSKLIVNVDDIEEKNRFLDTAYGLWGHVWHEHDLVLMFSYKLLKYIESKNLDMHLHINYVLKPRNFKAIESFYQKLLKAVNSIRNRLGMSRKWFPEIDLIVARDEPPFVYCLEFKYYHYLPDTNVINDIERKIVILELLKEYDVCNNVGLLLLDDAICRRSQTLCNKLRAILGNASKRILILDYYVNYEELVSMLKQCKLKIVNSML